MCQAGLMGTAICPRISAVGANLMSASEHRSTTPSLSSGVSARATGLENGLRLPLCAARWRHDGVLGDVQDRHSAETRRPKQGKLQGVRISASRAARDNWSIAF